MYTLNHEAIEVLIPTLISDVEDDTAKISLFLGETKLDLQLQRMASIDSVEQWREEIQEDVEPVNRTAFLYGAYPSTLEYVSGKICIGDIRISENRFAEVWPIPSSVQTEA